jgi:hypothetical protein
VVFYDLTTVRIHGEGEVDVPTGSTGPSGARKTRLLMSFRSLGSASGTSLRSTNYGGTSGSIPL